MPSSLGTGPPLLYTFPRIPCPPVHSRWSILSRIWLRSCTQKPISFSRSVSTCFNFSSSYSFYSWRSCSYYPFKKVFWFLRSIVFSATFFSFSSRARSFSAFSSSIYCCLSRRLDSLCLRHSSKSACNLERCLAVFLAFPWPSLVSETDF